MMFTNEALAAENKRMSRQQDFRPLGKRRYFIDTSVTCTVCEAWEVVEADAPVRASSVDGDRPRYGVAGFLPRPSGASPRTKPKCPSRE